MITITNDNFINLAKIDPRLAKRLLGLSQEFQDENV